MVSIRSMMDRVLVYFRVPLRLLPPSVTTVSSLSDTSNRITVFQPTGVLLPLVVVVVVVVVVV